VTTTGEALGGMNLFDAARAAGVTFSADVLPSDHHVQANGMRLHYLDWGNTHLPPMVLLHGGAQSAHSWDFFALALRDHFHVVAVDQRGHGDSDWSEAGDYDAPFHVADLAHFTDLLGIDRFVLVGLSMGGRNAYSFAAHHPQRVERLVIVDVGPDVAAAGGPHHHEVMEGPHPRESVDRLLEPGLPDNPPRVAATSRSSWRAPTPSSPSTGSSNGCSATTPAGPRCRCGAA
jgi:pimeloyl-ACP methyl ester carboxylesterase